MMAVTGQECSWRIHESLKDNSMSQRVDTVGWKNVSFIKCDKMAFVSNV